MLVFVVDLHVDDARELLHCVGEGLHNVVARAVGATDARKIDVERAVGELDPPIADESVPNGNQAPALLLCIGTLEVFV